MPAFEENPNDLRESLDAAFTAAEAPPPPAPEGETTPPEGEVEQQEAAPPAPEGAVPPPEGEKPPPEGEVPPPEGEKKPAEITPAPPPGDPDTKAPGTWTPGAREKWATLPKEVRQEVWKRERDASRAMTVSAEARRFQNEFSQAVQPFLGFIAAEQSTPIKAMTNMMQTAAALRVGTPTQKADLVAGIIKNFAVDLNTLDSLLAGQRPSNNPQDHVQQLVAQQLAPVHQLLNQHRDQQAQAEQRMEQEVATELAAFADANEFYPDVKEIMADLMEVAKRRGEEMGLTAAYERATLMHDPVRRVIEARKQRETLLKGNKAAQEAKGNAASVVPSSEVSQVRTIQGDDLRASIEAAFSAQQGR